MSKPPREAISPDDHRNRLALETSAYLRQHMHNVVDWYPWGDEAFAQAQSESKPVLISIGYSACHWCHVMAHESFEDPETAALMNHHFVNVKVDREERPDVDKIYMDVATRLMGRGGWPLTVFCTPDGRPFYCGTYFPDEPRHGMPSFRQVLLSLSQAYREQRDDVEANAEQIMAALAPQLSDRAQGEFEPQPIVRAAEALLQSADRTNGGFGEAPKFPTPTNLDFLLAALDFLAPEVAQTALEHCARSCQAMARRGLYDHLGGGFHRYCVDARWQIPHFEKMLYDQGLLLRIYAEMFRRSEGNPEFAWPLQETAAFLRRELAGAEGGYCASQDADSEGAEGLFYVWTPPQIEAVLGPDSAAAAFCSAYGVTPEGNFEAGTTHLVDRTLDRRSVFAAERQALAEARSRRVAPDTDKKRVAAWNGYVISGLARAAAALEDDLLLADAVAAADFTLQQMVPADGRLQRIFDAAGARIPAFLDDHAALLDAYLDLYRAGGGDRFLAAAMQLADDIRERFFDAARGELFLTPSDAAPLFHRPRSDGDGATPDAASLACVGLLRCASLSGRKDLRDMAEQILRGQDALLERAPQALPTLLRALALWLRGAAVVVIGGHLEDPETQRLAARARREFLPEDAIVVSDGTQPTPGLDPSWLAGRAVPDFRPRAFVCRGESCSLPTSDPEELARLAGRASR